MRKLMTLLLIIATVFFILTACNKSSVQQLSTDKRTNDGQQENSYIPLPSNKERNHQKRKNDPEVVSYADQYGKFLEQMNLQFDEIDELLNEHNFSEEEIQRMKNRVKKMQQLVNDLNNEEAPKPFQDLKTIHDTILIELQMLDETLQKKQLNDEKNRRLARVYFENIVSYHRSMQSEYRITTAELGIY